MEQRHVLNLGLTPKIMLVLFLYVFLHCRTNCCHQMQNPWPVLFVVAHCSVTQSCLTLCDPVYCSTPGFPVLHHLPELAQTHIHLVSGATQPSRPLSPPSPPALSLSQHQGLFNESALHIRGSKFWSFSFSISLSNEYSGLISFRIGWYVLLAAQGTLKSHL